MDTQSLNTVVDDPQVPESALAAVRLGGRIAFELLRARSLPLRILLTAEELREVGGGRGTFESRSAGLGSSSPILYEISPTLLSLSYPAICRARHLGVVAGDVRSLHQGLSFVAGYAATQYVADSLWRQELSPAWMEGLGAAISEGGAGRGERLSGLVASVSSGFTLAPRTGAADAQDEVITFYLHRLACIAQKEGIAALWRGALGRSVRALVQEVRFSTAQGRVSAAGQRLESLEGVLPLLRYAQGAGPWPFAEVHP